MMHLLRISILAGATALLVLASPNGQAGTSASQTVHFSSAASYSKADILFRRMLIPRSYAALRSSIAAREGSLDVLTIDPREEEWTLYVSEHADDNDSKPGVLVWLSDDANGGLDPDWTALFDASNLIFVSAHNASKDADLIQRRTALALNGLHGVTQQYSIDPQRIYIGGDGSGAQAASRIALGFGDIFKGGIFLRGPMALATQSAPLPTGGELVVDSANRYVVINATGHSGQPFASAMRDACLMHVRVVDFAKQPMHEALTLLENEMARPAGPAQDCIADLSKRIDSDVNKIRKLLKDNKPEEAAKAWHETYTRYGGLLGGGMDALGDKIASQLSDIELGQFMHDSVFGQHQIPHFQKPKMTPSKR